jgi:hypothetical protein
MAMAWRLIVILVVGLMFNPAFVLSAPTGADDTLFNEQGEVLFPDFPSEPGVDCVPNQVIAQFLNNVILLPLGAGEAKIEECQIDSELLDILDNYEVYLIEKIYKNFTAEDTIIELQDGRIVGINDLSQVFLLNLLDNGHNIFYLITELQGYHECYFAEPNGIIHAEDDPDDTYYESGAQWNLYDWSPAQNKFGVGMPTAWHQQKSGKWVGLIDSGIDWNHPDLSQGEPYPNQRILAGYDFVDDDEYPYSNSFGHATSTGGIIGAATCNDEGIASIAGDWYWPIPHGWSGIVPLRIIDDNNQGNIGDACAAILEAIDRGCDVMSNSYGFYRYSEALRGAVCIAAQANRTFVASKGNNGSNQYHIPSDIDGSWVISVGAYLQNSNRANYSNWGNNVDMLAPAGVVTTAPNNTYTIFSGTSAAAPHAAGVAALMIVLYWFDYNQYLHEDDIDRILCYSAIDGGAPGYDDYYGNGRLNAGIAFTRLARNQAIHPPWQLFIHRTEPGYDEIAEIIDGYGAFNNRVGYDLPTKHYLYRRYDLRVNVDYEETFIEIPKVWGRGMNASKGWSGAIPNNMAEYCGAVLETEQIDGCQLQTWVYEIWDWDPFFPWIPHVYLGWYPCPPEEVECEYVIWGRLDPNPPPPPTRPDSSEGKVAIEQNGILLGETLYPNPFNNNINIGVSLAQSTQLNIAIYDILGRLKGKIHTGILPSGTHEFTWSAMDDNQNPLSSGVYFVKFDYPNATKISKAILLR